MGWLIALGVLTALALLPIGVGVKYNEDGFSLCALIGFLPISLTGGKKKEKKPKKKKKAPKKGERSGGKKPQAEKKGGSVKDFMPLLRVALDFLNDFRRKLCLRRLEMKLIMAADDPCDLAVNYGRAWIALGNLMPQLERCFTIKKRDLEVECDFEASETVIIARADVVIPMGMVVWLVLRYGLKALKKYLKIINLRKGGGSK